jgi:hypothetical protein
MKSWPKWSIEDLLQPIRPYTSRHKVIERFFNRRHHAKHDLIRRGYPEAKAISAANRLIPKRKLEEWLLNSESLGAKCGITSKRKAHQAATKLIEIYSTRAIA